MEQEILFFIIAFISEIIGTIAGFGSSTVFMPLALFFVDFKTAIILVAIFHIFGDIGRITFFKRGLNIRLLLAFGLPSVLLSLVGALLIGMLPQSILKLILGIVLVTFSALSLTRPDLRFPASRGTLLLGGSVSGFIIGLIGTGGGALRAAFLSGLNLDKLTYIATALMQLEFQCTCRRDFCRSNSITTYPFCLQWL